MAPPADRKEVTTTHTFATEKPLLFGRISGLDEKQLDEVEDRVAELLEVPWDKGTGRPREITFREALVITCGYMRQNIIEDVWANIFDVDQSTISRIITFLTPLVEQATAEFRPAPEEAAEATMGAVELVDGTLWPCWSWDGERELWSGKYKTTGHRSLIVANLQSRITITDDEQKVTEGKPAGFRAYGKSKDHRDDLPQVVIGMAVTQDGIPVRVWCWPGNTNDSALIRQVKDDMRDWTLSRLVWVADGGFTSAENRRYLRSGDHHYIIGEKLRSGSAEADAVLSRQGRYQDVAANLRVKEVRISESGRFVICFNPEAAERDAALRARKLAQLEEMITGSDTLTATKRAELRGVISTKPGLNRYLRVTPSGLGRESAPFMGASRCLLFGQRRSPVVRRERFWSLA
jgi:hypothetical protein